MKEPPNTLPTDFFNRIVEKARGAESAIAPRLPSLFEPLPGAAVAPSPDAEEPAPAVAAHELEAHRPTPMTPRNPIMHELRPLTSHSVETAEQGNEFVPRENDRPVRAAEVAPMGRLQPLPVVTRIVESPATRPNEQKPDEKPESGVMRSDKTRLSRTWESEHEVPQPQQLHKELGVLMPKPAAIPVPFTIGMNAPRVDSPTGRGFAANTPLAEQPAPVINVTIGRVEVRAAQAPTARPRANATKPKPLSLDDYLKQRGGGR